MNHFVYVSVVANPFQGAGHLTKMFIFLSIVCQKLNRSVVSRELLNK